jgi:hypothetical protein
MDDFENSFVWKNNNINVNRILELTSDKIDEVPLLNNDNYTDYELLEN